MTNAVIDALKARRSVRSFRPEQIKDEELLAVLEAGTYAPTGRNRQTPVIVAVQDKADRDAVSALNAEVGGMTGDPYYGAPTIILVLALDDDFAQLNGAAVETNMLNAAYSLGLGSCWIHRPQLMFRTEKGKALLKKWGLDENLVGVCSIALGYSAVPAPAASPRKEGYFKIIK